MLSHRVQKNRFPIQGGVTLDTTLGLVAMSSFLYDTYSYLEFSMKAIFLLIVKNVC